jgi:hypothetical protein
MGAKFLPSVRWFVRGAAGDFCAVSAATYEAQEGVRSTFVTTRLNDDVRDAEARRRGESAHAVLDNGRARIEKKRPTWMSASSRR